MTAKAAAGHPMGREAALEVSVEPGNRADAASLRDDDGRPRRTGTVWTASAHIITAVIGAGVLSLAWAMAQLGWAAGTAMMLLFAGISYYTSTLLAECYRCGGGDAVHGKRNYTYTEAVRAILGGAKVRLCGVIQYANLVGIAIGYTIAASISMMAIKRADCFHAKGHRNACRSSSNPYMLLFGAIEVVFSQIPDFDQIWWLSIVAAAMSFTYATIGLAQTVANGGFKGSLTGVGVGSDGVTPMQKVWRSLQAFGDISFAYSFAYILIEIQDTIKAPPPSEATVMKKATMVSVATTTAFYLLCGCMGYAAFGDGAPDNLLTGFGFYEPFWLLDIANAAIVVHLVGAYQVFCQPLFAFVEKRAAARWPDSRFMAREVRLGPFLRLGAFGVRLPHHRRRHDAPLLRRRRGPPRRRLLLAAHRLLPRRDVHRAARRAQVERALGLPPDAQRRVPPRLRRRRRWLHRRRHRRRQAAPAVQWLRASAAPCIINHARLIFRQPKPIALLLLLLAMRQKGTSSQTEPSSLLAAAA